MTDRAAATLDTTRIAAPGPVGSDGRIGTSSLRSDRRASASGGFFPVIRRWAVVIAVATGIATVVGFALAQRATPTYQARAELLVGPLNTDIATVRTASGATATYVQLAGAPATIEVVARRTGVERSVLYDGVRATADPEARILTVRARAHTSQDAADAANGVAERLTELAADDSVSPAGRLSRIDEATPPSAPISPRVEVIVPLAAMGGLLAGLALVMVLELVGDQAGSASDVRRATGVPTLSLRPAGADAGAPQGGEVVATDLALLRPRAASVLITRTGAVEVGDRVALDLATTWARSRGPVVLIDAVTGVTTTVTAEGERSAGDGATISLAGSHRVADLVSSGTSVVVDSPAGRTADATLAWALAVEVTVLVCRSDATRRGPLAEAADALRHVGADLALAVVLPGEHLGRHRRSRARGGPAMSDRSPEVVPA